MSVFIMQVNDKRGGQSVQTSRTFEKECDRLIFCLIKTLDLVCTLQGAATSLHYMIMMLYAVLLHTGRS